MKTMQFVKMDGAGNDFVVAAELPGNMVLPMRSVPFATAAGVSGRMVC